MQGSVLPKLWCEDLVVDGEGDYKKAQVQTAVVKDHSGEAEVCRMGPIADWGFVVSVGSRRGERGPPWRLPTDTAN